MENYIFVHCTIHGTFYLEIDELTYVNHGLPKIFLVGHGLICKLFVEMSK